MSARRAAPRSPRRWRAALAAGVAASLLVTGCTSLPESGPVVDAEGDTSVEEGAASDINVVPPRDGARPVDIAKGFINAMTASPIRVDVAREYLSESAAGEWDPEAGTIIYADKSQPRDRGDGRVEVALVDAQGLDRNGAYEGRLPPEQQVLDLRMTFESGQYRISNPPDALVVPTTWFEQRFRQASLYFFDPTGRILVPEPVFVPRGDQLATSLVGRLLAGPVDALRRTTRSYLPTGLTAGLSVPITPDGVADISLSSDPGEMSPDNVDRMLAQLAWTLRQEPTIRAFRLTFGDRVVRAPGGSDEFGLTEGAEYDPVGPQPSGDIFGLRGGVLVQRAGNELRPTTGPLGTTRRALRSVVVDAQEQDAAAVTADGTTLLVAPVRALDGPARVTRPVVGASDLLPPAWDLTGRLWLVDRSPAGAVVRVVRDGRSRVVQVPGVSGRRVRSFTVSRDGTRLVAVVAGQSDDLRVARVETGDRQVRVAASQSLLRDPEAEVRVLDVAWTSPVTLAALVPVVPNQIYEVRPVSVDGAPAAEDSTTVTVPEPLLALTASPLAGTPTFGVTASGLVDLDTGAAYGFVDGPPPRSLRYAG